MTAFVPAIIGQHMLNKGLADVISFWRMFISNPDLPRRLAAIQLRNANDRVTQPRREYEMDDDV